MAYLVGKENFIAIFNKTHNSTTLAKFTNFINIQKKVYPILKLVHAHQSNIYFEVLNFCRENDEKEIYNYFIHFFEFFSFLLGKSQAILYLFLYWFIPKTFYEKSSRSKNETNPSNDGSLNFEQPITFEEKSFFAQKVWNFILLLIYFYIYLP